MKARDCFLKRPVYKLRLKSQTITLGIKTKIMGVINLTPDSFSSDGLFKNNSKEYIAKVIDLAQKMIADGADIIDIGGESSRPGAEIISVEEESRRVIPVLKVLVKKIKFPISVDTYKPEVVYQSLQEGASIINNIKGVDVDRKILKVIAKSKAGIVLMHSRGNAKTMQRMTNYKNLIREIAEQLKRSVGNCLESGINSDRIIIDPGIGFAKTAQQNLEIINQLYKFHQIGLPILVGPSRKSFVGKVLNNKVADRLMGTLASVSVSVLRGAHVIRVHDVKEAKQVLAISDAIINESIK